MQHALRPDLKIAATPELVEHGSVVIIGIDEIRRRAGSSWERMRSSIYARLEALLRQKLGPTDYFVQIDDLSFLVSIPSATADEAQIQCLRVIHELHTSMLGACEIGELQIAYATGIEGDLLICEPVTGPKLAKLAADALTSSIEGACARGLRRSPRFENNEPAHAVKYVPLWDAQSEVITTYRCVTVASQSFLEAPTQSQFNSDLKALIFRVRTATATLASRLSAGERFLVCLPVSFDLLSSPVTRMELNSLCRSLPASVRPYLLFEITEIPHGVPQSRLAELTASLRPFCRTIWGLMPPRSRSYITYQGCSLGAIGLSLSSGVVSASEMMGDITKLSAAADISHVKTFLLDVANPDMLLFARGLKVNMISGPLVGDPTDEPAPISRRHLAEILQRCGGRSVRGNPEMCALAG